MAGAVEQRRCGIRRERRREPRAGRDHSGPISRAAVLDRADASAARGFFSAMRRSPSVKAAIASASFGIVVGCGLRCRATSSAAVGSAVFGPLSATANCSACTRFNSALASILRTISGKYSRIAGSEPSNPANAVNMHLSVCRARATLLRARPATFGVVLTPRRAPGTPKNTMADRPSGRPPASARESPRRTAAS